MKRAAGVAAVLSALLGACDAQGARPPTDPNGAPSPPVPLGDPVVVNLPGLGDVEGHLRASDRTEVFLGMPYAEPPTGALRFMPAQQKESWTGALDAHQYGHQCLQGGLFGL